MKKKRPYLITTGIVLLLFFILFLAKGIFPFGNHSLIWGDMHDQITAFYYHFYDCFHGNASLLIDFSTSGGINFLGIMAYYILSPFSFLVLLFDRDQIYLAVSIIIALKVLLASLTSLYFIRTFFKKLPNMLAVLLAIIYAFSGYTMIMYQITPWMDAVYMLPLIMIGLKKVLDGESPVFYLVTLTISIILCFYISYMIVIFIFFASMFYLLVYKKKGERKKGVLALGITTILAMAMSAFIVLPAYKQISVSSRLDFNIDTLLNSGTGPIVDKTSFFAPEALYLLAFLLLLIDWKKHRKFLSWFLPTLLVMLIPYVIEPVNKIWHFGSYAFFPYRMGLIAIFLLMVGAGYYFNQWKDHTTLVDTKRKAMSVMMSLLVMTSLIVVTVFTYQRFQAAVNGLTISEDRFLIFFLGFMTLAVMVGIYVVLYLNHKKNGFVLFLMLLMTCTHLSCISFLYMGIDSDQGYLMGQYEDLQKFGHTHREGDYYRVKTLTSKLIMNSGMVSNYHTLDHFTSLTDRNNLETLKKLGYSSMWVKTFSRGGSLFTDALFANKYILTKVKLDDDQEFLEYYRYVDQYGELYLYEAKITPSYGYFIQENATIFDKKNAFAAQNALYHAVTGSSDALFKIHDQFTLENLKQKSKGENFEYHIIDDERYSYLTMELDVTEKSIVYLDMLKSLVNTDNYDIYQKFNIYINDQLYRKDYPTENDNGLLKIGTFENEKLLIKIELKRDVELHNLTIGEMNVGRYNQFLEEYQVDSKIEYDRNHLRANVTSDQRKIYFLPVTYNEGYRVKVNGKEQEVVRVFENYLGVEVGEGTSQIEFTYTPEGMKFGLVLSAISLIVTFVIVKFGIYKKMLTSNFLTTVAWWIYLVLYLLALLIVYVLPTIFFILSYFIYIHLPL